MRLPPLWVVGLIWLNLLLSLQVVVALLLVPSIRDGGPDWEAFVLAGERIVSGASPYVAQGDHFFRWSPVAAYLLALITPIGLLGWTLLHFAALTFRREWRLIAAFLVAWPLWFDIDLGNTLTFVAVAAILALRGSLAWTLVFYAFCLLMPRPLMLPLLAWLLWYRPTTRLPLAALAAGLMALTLATGWAGQWITSRSRRAVIRSPMNGTSAPHA